MCGITGWINREGDLSQQRHTLEAMTQTLSKRGPDACGTWLSPHAALGHRRLVVVDPAGGGQPMVRKRGDETYVLVYNGELYNTPELRSDLAARGYTFEGHSDTEVLLLAYMEWGPSCVERFNGIYAFAVWSEQEQSLFLARDRMGVKPLFYAERGSSFIFGSELKALLANPLIEPELDQEGLAEIFVLGPSRTPGHGVFRNVGEVKPGWCLFNNRSGTKKWRYWAPESHPHTDDLETTSQKVYHLLKDSIERQLVADVPVCTFLSGGLDSSAITLFASDFFKKNSRGELHTYSVDFAGNESFFKTNEFQPNADSEWVGKVSGFLDTVHHYITIDTPEMALALYDAMLARDLPGMADIDSSLYLFCCQIKKDFTVALSGECADEIFGGYPWFHNEETLNSGTFPWIRSLKPRLYTPELLESIKPQAYIERRYRETLEEVPRLPGEDPLEERRREMFYLNMMWFMQTLLDRKDRMSMATGLEVRVPFCDHRIVEYVWNIPWAMKTHGNREKGILRRALKGFLPDGVVERKKSPYPKTYNPSYLEAVRKLLLNVLDDANSPLAQLINAAEIRSMVANPGSGAFQRPWFGQLMAEAQFYAYLVQTDMWLREYKVVIK